MSADALDIRQAIHARAGEHQTAQASIAPPPPHRGRAPDVVIETRGGRIRRVMVSHPDTIISIYDWDTIMTDPDYSPEQARRELVEHAQKMTEAWI